MGRTIPGMGGAKYPAAPRVNVVITDKMIMEAIPKDSSHCMIAEAIKKAVPSAAWVSVDLQTVRFSDWEKGFRYSYLTPRIGQEALVRWDAGIKPEPFSFTLRGGHVTLSGKKRTKIKITDKKKLHLERMRLSAEAKLRRSKIVDRHIDNGKVVERVGGKQPPLQPSKTTSVPFTRRRAFGIRALEL